MKAYCLFVVVLLLGNVCAQLTFDDYIPPRADTVAADSVKPCGGHPIGDNYRVNSSDFEICGDVAGNHGFPNIVNFYIATLIDPLGDSNFTLSAKQTIKDGMLGAVCFNASLADGTQKTYRYTTGDFYYTYCFDVQHGDLPAIKDAASALSYSAILLFTVLAFVL